MKPVAVTLSTRPAERIRLALAAAIALGVCAFGAPACADPRTPFDDLPALADDELQTLRGGFEFAGLQFDFGANLRTYVDGRLALESVITYADGNVRTEHLPSNLSGAGVTSGEDGRIQALSPGQALTPAQLNLNGVDLSGIKDAAGILIDDRSGAVLALHQATRERITSLVVNQSSGRDIRQEFDVNVTVQNFAQFRDSVRGAILNGRLTATPR